MTWTTDRLRSVVCPPHSPVGWHSMSGTSVMDTFFSDGAQGQARRGPNGSGFQVPFAESAFGFGHFDAGAMFAQHQHMMRSLSEGSFGPMGFLPGPGRAYGAQVPRSPILLCARPSLAVVCGLERGPAVETLVS